MMAEPCFRLMDVIFLIFFFPAPASRIRVDTVFESRSRSESVFRRTRLCLVRENNSRRI